MAPEPDSCELLCLDLPMAEGVRAAMPGLEALEAWSAAAKALGDNTGSMALKGGSPEYEGEPRPDRWQLDDRLAAVAARWAIEPARDLAQSPVPAGSTGSPAARQA